MNLSRRAQPWLGTMVEIAAGDAAAIDAAFALVAHIHHCMSPQQPSSDLARFNVAEAGANIVCDPHTYVVLQAAQALAEASHEAFDPTLGSGGLRAWSLRETALLKHRNRSKLDLGGIAKGYAVDCAVSVLQERGVSAGWVNAGGDLRVFGDIELPIHIRHRKDPAQSAPLIALRDGACATSVLPLSCGGSAHISIAAPQCLWADALTKVVAYASPSVSAALLARYDARSFQHLF